MRDYKHRDCPECGTALQFGSGCYFCPACGYGRCGRQIKEGLRTAFAFGILMALLSLMGWSVTEHYPTTPTAASLALSTYQINSTAKSMMTAQARGY